MDDLDLLREHFPKSPPPSHDARRQVSALLVQAIRDEAHRATTAGDRQRPLSRVLRLMRTRPTSSALGLATLVAAAVAAALFLTAPWQNSPGFLAKAQAALTPPQGSVLHIKWESTYSNSQCTITRGPNEIWIDQTEPHRYRALFFDNDPNRPGDYRAHRCSKSTHFEWGGTLTFGARAEWSLRFVPPNELTFQTNAFFAPSNPVADLRRAISEGRAHDEGKTTLHGRTVERIRVLGSLPCGDPYTRCGGTAYFYVDPHTFAPVALDGRFGGIAPPGRRPDPVTRSLTRYLTFEYLPRTAPNLALTNIHAQHPNATGP